MENYYPDYLREQQRDAIQNQKEHSKCLINMWCGTGKTRTFTIDLFINKENFNVIVFPSLGLINQYSNDYILNSNEPFKTDFKRYSCIAFCSDDDGNLKIKGKIKFTTEETHFDRFLKQKKDKIALVTYQSFEKFINICIDKNIIINNLIYDEAHHIVGDKIQNIVFNNEELDDIVDKTRFYTATPVNKNGITMYDRDDDENSDCGPLAYEYLYYQAVKDGICKDFESRISLYTQKPEYKNKYQPIFEFIIRACLSGKYNYWNTLTYHSFVNENEDMSDNISFVKEFASAENQKLVKQLFTRIQNEEFLDTKDTYSVKNVILKEVHSKTPNREKIIQDFDRKVPGRIYILSSCGILNEGRDTKWANMAVPINPTNSIVKESQRIGRLVRIPEANMSPAIILIPCEVDSRKYASMNTPELRDQMIREELSECGNFNTPLNVISAFKYQYDPELYEMCLRYPTMYAPKEIKDNLANQGLIVEDSQGDLLDNLKYVCYNEQIELDIESFEGESETDVLNEIAEQTEKTIEIHTQNHDEPVKYINEDANDDEPLRLFYCEDDNTYAPITKKDKKTVIKKKSTTSPIKRKKLFDVHTHPDLEVLWKIDESSIDLNKAFSQGILDVDIKWNDKQWNVNYDLLKKYTEDNKKCPPRLYITEDGVNLGVWCDTQRTTKKKNKISKERIELLEKLPFWVWEYDLDEQWNENYDLLKKYTEDNKKCPISSYITEDDLHIGGWLTHQRTMKKDGQLSKEKFKLLDELPFWVWEPHDEKWNKNYELLKKEKNLPKDSYITEDDLHIGSWCNKQRRDKKNDNLSDEKIKLLDELPFWVWDTLDERWIMKYKLLKKYTEDNEKCPPCSYKTKDGVNLGSWCGTQRHDKKNDKLLKERIKLLDELPFWVWECDLDEPWNENYDLLKKYTEDNKKCPIVKYKTKDGVNLGGWCDKQRQDKKKNNLSKEKIKLLDELPFWVWDFKTKKPTKNMSKPDIKPKKSSQEIKQEQQQRTKSEISILHQKYKTLNSQNLNAYFNENPKKWEEYHQISKQNEESFPEEEIPRNKMIKYLDNLPGKKHKVIADLGCGFAEINHYFTDNSRFTFHNFDHHSSNELVISRDIKDTEIPNYSIDIAILSLSMWGSNCKDYLEEAYRILDTGGILLIAEPYKRWYDEDKQENKLETLLKENNFTIKKNDEQKFMFIECIKI